MKRLPTFIDEMLAEPPKAGEGVHLWLFRVARQLHAHMPALAMIDLLESRVQGCGRFVGRQEVAAAVRDALACAWQPGSKSGPVKAVAKWPKVNKEQREAITRDGGGVADLWELAQPRIEDGRAHTEAIIDRLFPGNPLLCCGSTNYDFDTKPREDWRGQMTELALIVPSPMATLEGLTKEGKTSKHSLSNTGPRRFLICEFDSGTVDEHAALLLHLGSMAPLVCAVHSGGKSLHGWFLVADQPQDRVLRFFRYAANLGADPRMWTKCQFCRVPNGRRGNGNRQTVFYLNFTPLEAAK